MAKILSINGRETGEKSSFLGLFKNWFSSQDRFVKNAFIVFVLLVIAMPFIISNRLSLLQHAAPNGSVAFVSANNTPLTETTSPDVHLQLAYPESWSLSQVMPQKEVIQKAYAVTNSCDFASPKDGDSFDTNIPGTTITGARSDPSYYIALYIEGKSPGSIQGDSMQTSQLPLGFVGSGFDALHFVCRVQTGPANGNDGTIVFSKTITLHRFTTSPTVTNTPTQPVATATVVPTVTSVPTPTVRVQVTPTNTPIPTNTPTVVPSKPVLFRITIQNADTTGQETRILSITGAQNIANALSASLPWRLNPLVSGEMSNQRSVEVIYYAHTSTGDAQASVTANILLSRPSPSITPSATPVEQSPTPTPLGEFVSPTNTPVPTGILSPTPTIVLIGSPTVSPTARPTVPVTATPGISTPTPTVILSATPTETPAPVQGDVDNNGCVDTNDFNIWAEAFQSQRVRSGTNPDIDHDGRIAINDASIWYQVMQSGQHLCH